MKPTRFATRIFFCIITLTLAVALTGVLTGCGGQTSAPTDSTAGAPPDQSTAAGARLVIISPHGREIQTEFERVFATKHPNIKLQWLDQGGSSNALRFVLDQFKTKQKGEGINVDVFFGGGLETFMELEDAGLLQPLPSNYGVPATLNGVPLRGKNNQWLGAALSGFGILYNKTVVTRDRLPIPKVWGGLGNFKLQNRVELADPRQSGSAHVAYEIILQTNGWQNGWQVLTAMAANARKFVTSSSQLPEDVSNGEAAMAPAIDFYARSRIAQAGADKIGYIEPQGQSVVIPDPIGILRGAPNQKAARDFVAFVLSPAGQKLWMLKKGAPGGPAQEELFRMAVLPSLYKPLPKDSLVRSNPFASRNARPYDAKKAALRRKVLDDLIGVVLIDNHDRLKSRNQTFADAGKIAFVPANETEVLQLAKKWNDTTLRQQKLTEWRDAARKRFQ